MEVLAAGHLPLRLPWSGDTHQSNARPTLRAASRPLCGVLCNVSSIRSAPFGDGRNASMPAHASGGDGGSGGPRAFPPTGEEDGGGAHPRSFLTLFVGSLYACTRVPPAGALFKKKKKPETIDEFSGRIAKLYWPIMQNLGFSGALGLASGLALRAVSQAVAVALGVMFIIIQGAAYMGFLEVKWATVHKEVIRRLDVNRDGKFDASDFKSLLASGLAILSQGVPSVGGFMTGFALGVK